MGDIVDFKKPKSAYACEDSLNHLAVTPEEIEGFAITDREYQGLTESKIYSFKDVLEFHKVESKVYKDKAAFYWKTMVDWASTQSPDTQLLVNKMKFCYEHEMQE